MLGYKCNTFFQDYQILKSKYLHWYYICKFSLNQLIKIICHVSKELWNPIIVITQQNVTICRYFLIKLNTDVTFPAAQTVS